MCGSRFGVALFREHLIQHFQHRFQKAASLQKNSAGMSVGLQSGNKRALPLYALTLLGNMFWGSMGRAFGGTLWFRGRYHFSMFRRDAVLSDSLMPKPAR